MKIYFFFLFLLLILSHAWSPQAWGQSNASSLIVESLHGLLTMTQDACSNNDEVSDVSRVRSNNPCFDDQDWETYKQERGRKKKEQSGYDRRFENFFRSSKFSSYD